MEEVLLVVVTSKQKRFALKRKTNRRNKKPKWKQKVKKNENTLLLIPHPAGAEGCGMCG